MATIFSTFRLTGDVTNGEAADLRTRLAELFAAAQSVGVDVKRSVDVRLDPEPEPVVEPEPEPVVAAVDDVPAEDPA